MADYPNRTRSSSDGVERRWLERMHQLLQWKVTYPQATDPFQEPIPTDKLRELATNKKVLFRKIGLRCLLDGIEIITIKNLFTFSLTTDHPQLTKLKQVDCQRYFKSCGVVEMVEREVEKIQAGYQEVLAERAKEKKKKNY